MDRACQKISIFFFENKYTEAINAGENALEIAKKKFGAQHPNIAMPLNNLADIYSAYKKYDKAENLYLQAIVMLENLLGENHPDLAKFKNNLAIFYYYEEKYTKAEPLLKEALAIYEKQDKKDYADIAEVLNNLSALYESQKKHDEADLFKRRHEEIIKNATVKYHLAKGVSYPIIEGENFVVFDEAAMLTDAHKITVYDLINVFFTKNNVSFFYLT